MVIRQGALEGLVTMFDGVFRGRRVLLTGHTGFKGSWLALWLTRMGAEVTGIALEPDTDPAHWNLLDLPIRSHLIDIRNREAVTKAVRECNPEVVFHLAAQPLVRRSYRDPIETWEVNVIGTAHVLDACRSLDSLQAIVCVTTDKCYENHEWVWGYRETDPLGGHDPYSASKAGTELVAASYRRSFFEERGVLLATGRAGNVIGGGDWSEARLVPDLARSVAAGETVEIRSPDSTRPWQHVLDSLSGYLMLAEGMLKGRQHLAEAWNFGPDKESNRTVAKVLESMQHRWPSLKWKVSNDTHVHEARLLYLDASKARDVLTWTPVWGFEDTIDATAGWYDAWISEGQVLSEHQLDEYCAGARALELGWSIGT